MSGVLLAKVFGNQARDATRYHENTSAWPAWKSASR